MNRMIGKSEFNEQTTTSISAFSWKSIGIAFAIWTLLGFSFTSETYLRHYKAGMLVFPAWMYLVEILTSTYIYALFSPLVFKLGRKIPLEFKIPAASFIGRTLIHLTASLIFSMSSLYLGSFIAYQW